MRTSPTEITYDEADHVGVITLNRPEARNALTFTTYAELEDAVRSTTARCLVITGADPAFCSGDDVKQIMQSAGDRVASDLAADAADHPRRRGAAHHRRPGDRGRERRRRRVGHGAGGDGRPARRVGAGQVRRAVREARAVAATWPASGGSPSWSAASTPPSCSSPGRVIDAEEAQADRAGEPGRAPRRAPAHRDGAGPVDRVEPAARRPAHEAGAAAGPRPGLDRARARG